MIPSGRGFYPGWSTADSAWKKITFGTHSQFFPSRSCHQHPNVSFKADSITNSQELILESLSCPLWTTARCDDNFPFQALYVTSQENTKSESRGFVLPKINNFTACVLTPCIFPCHAMPFDFSTDIT